MSTEKAQQESQLIGYKQLLRDNRRILSRSLTITDWLMYELSEVGFIADNVENIEKQQTHEGKVHELLRTLRRVPDDQQESVFGAFLSALREAGQEHVANVFRPESDARPMSDEHYQLIGSKRKKVCQFMDLKGGLIDELIDLEVLNKGEEQTIKSKDGLYEMAAEIVEIIQRKSDSSFDNFISALSNTEQEHIMHILGQETDGVPMTEEHRCLLRDHMEKFRQSLDPNCGLLDKLVNPDKGPRALNERHMNCFPKDAGYRDMTVELLGILPRRPDSAFGTFITALLSTGQGHVAYILTEEGVERPMSPRRIDILREKGDKFIASVDSDHTPLIQMLYSRGVLNKTDKELIDRPQVSPNKRNSDLLSAIERKSNSAFDKLLQALVDTGQDHVAAIFDGRKISMTANPNFDNSTTDQSQQCVITMVCDRMDKLATDPNPNLENIVRAIEQNGFEVAEIRLNSIHVLFRCYTEESLSNLRRLYLDRTLDNLFSDAFCPEFREHGLRSLSFYVDDKEFVECAEAFKALALMSKEHRKTLQEAVKKVGDKINVEEILSKLSPCPWRADAVRNSAQPGRTLLDVVLRQPDRAFAQLVKALRETGQNEVADFIDGCNSGAAILTDDGGLENAGQSDITASNEALMCVESIDITTEANREPTTFLQPIDATLSVKTITEQTALTRLLMENFRLLSRSISLSPSLLNALSSTPFFRDKMSCFSQMETQEEKTKKLLEMMYEILQQGDESTFHDFLSALRLDEQEHVANIFEPMTDVRPMSDEHHNLLVAKAQQLVACIDPVSVLSRHRSERVFGSRDKSRAFGRLSHEILDILFRKPDSAFESFIDILLATGQEHAVYILTECGELSLLRLRQIFLTRGRNDLVRFAEITHSTLIARLIRGKVLTRTNARQVDERKTREDKINLLFDLIDVRCRSAYKKFLKALKRSDQEHLAVAIEGIELHGIVEMHYRSGASVKWLIVKVYSLIRKSKTSLVGDNKSAKALGVLMEQNAIAISDVNISKKSINITFRCFSEESLSKLREQDFNQSLQKMFSGAFCPDEFKQEGFETLTININDAEFDTCSKKFKQMSLMTDEHRRVLEEAPKHFNIPVSSDLLSKLNLSNRLESAIIDCEESGEKAKTLFDIVSRQPDEAFMQLASALGETGQNEVAQFFMEELPDVHDYCICNLPLELLELVLMRTFTILFAGHYKFHCKTHDAVQSVYTTLAAVCYNWWQTMNGWPQSPTGHWFRHQLGRSNIQNYCNPYVVSPRMQSCVRITETTCVRGIVHCDHKLFVVSKAPDKVFVFGSNNEQLPDINVEGLREPNDIVACTELKQLYVGGWAGNAGYVWRTNLDGTGVVRWLPTSPATASLFIPYSLSVTSRRLLVTTLNDELLLFGPDGVQLKRVTSSQMSSLRHAVETQHNTILAGHELPQQQISEVADDGHLIRIFSSRQYQLSRLRNLSVDSDGRVLVADTFNDRVLLLNSRLELERILLETDKHGLVGTPSRLCHVEESGLLIVASWESNCVQIFTVRKPLNLRKISTV